ncbi:alpha/beta hydrolase [Deinococcus ruber]|uniref:Phosphonate ABC transporter ATP-binding protein n=1 Tax=Deinococcus ruber TaxID=1848197 RepID=A0A918BUK3_9DEIO|nr:alpha/beta hydrolase-fold protein [Deinococcus ruber]GGQ93300.1 phosphonate ABC transporter ATP-binding protein [Deinococcus ruber]
MDYTHDFDTAVQTFVLTDLPASTPADAEFFLKTGLEGWQTGHSELKFEGRTLRRAYPIGTLLSFKVSRDVPGSEEGDAWGQRRPDRCQVVTGDATHELSVQSWMDSPLSERPSTLSAQTSLLNVHSPELGDEFAVLVWQPPQAKTAGQRFPVLYLHDGQNVFDQATAFAGRTWKAAEAAQALAEAGLPCILVAVTVRDAHRGSDYVPFEIAANGFHSSAAEYQAFLTGTLKLLIDARFPTWPDARHTAQAGSSFGGVASVYGGLSRPDVWGSIGAFSPSVWVQDSGLLAWSEQHPAPHTRVYVDMGDHEGTFTADAARLVNLTRWLAARLRQHVQDVVLTIGEGHWHNEDAWAARFPGFLRWWLEGLLD